MKHDQMKSAIQKKEDELKAKQEYTLELFNLIKDDCVDIVTQKQIECNFEYGTTLYSHEIIGAIVKCKGLDICRTEIDICCIHGVQDAWIRESTNSMSRLLLPPVNADEYMWKKYKKHNEAIQTRIDNACELIESIDAPLLMTSLRKYITSKGFKGKTYTHRYTGKRCDVMEFQTTKHKLLNQPSIHTSDEQITIYAFVGIVCALLIFGIIYLVS